jgi:glycosyltransferase involved in cell wall biosynthesis
LVGTGPLEAAMRSVPLPENLQTRFHGYCEPEMIRQHYQECDAMLFPTLGDEWGLVVDEALFSGLPVIGSCQAQSVSTLVRDGINGMVYDPDDPQSLGAAFDRFMALALADYRRMPQAARDSVAARTAQASADQFVHAVAMAIAGRRGLANQVGQDHLQPCEPTRHQPSSDAVAT